MPRDAVILPGSPAVGPYSHAVRSGEFLFVSGQTAYDAGAGVLPTGPIAKQTQGCFANLEAILTAAGLSFADVVQTQVFLVDMDDFAAMNAVFATKFDAPYPSRTTVGVASLPLGARVEIAAVARRHDA